MIIFRALIISSPLRAPETSTPFGDITSIG